jgi:hypothetical protein
MTHAVYVVDAVRTPIGRIGGGLAGVRPDDLAAGALRGLLARHDDLDPARIDDVHLGNGNGAGEENRNVARMASLLAGLPTSVPGVTENRLCGSGLEAIAAASREVAGGRGVDRDRRWGRVDDPGAVGGAEARVRLRAHHQQMHSTTLGWRLVNPAMPEQWTVRVRGGGRDPRRHVLDLPRGAGRVRPRQPPARRGGVGRGPLRREVLASYGAELDDRRVRAAGQLVDGGAREAQARVPARRGSVTAGNSSPMNDGAAALLLGDEGDRDERARPDGTHRVAPVSGSTRTSSAPAR